MKELPVCIAYKLRPRIQTQKRNQPKRQLNPLLDNLLPSAAL